ncbi:hypothetical protein ACVI1J_005841 [Bradyrhizobium diazoefficiens]|uniref:DUF6894 family protein n=1 Tax=Bradyrhizobium TaxID=374 RepID=UPI001E56A868|nr:MULTISPECIES: hypothetical protein [Bradyrhizobium]MCD9898127.1 hypothetical protein [Bradyrhizobium japonicum]WLA66514.1 hypothetical protein QNN01_06910 [Bradyrhizobium diazoefficiens]WLB28496.1 hypothetical protein QIH85_42975 [Bradyrhizobium japonicum]WRJ84750.1 hypothetical protein R3F78_07680 [Bradyrhizobium japonicum]WRJ93720.1 hypothetical protein R3F77_05390 [Bradyrhizobium japonicum]
MQRYYFPIIHNGRFQPDSDGEVFGSADLAGQYGARVARELGSDPDYDHASGTVVIVVDASGAEIARHVVVGVATAVQLARRQ